MFLSQNKPPEPSGGFFLMTTPFTFVLSFAAQLVRPFRSARLGSRPRSPFSWRTRALSFPCVARRTTHRIPLPVRNAFPREKSAAPCPRLMALEKLGLSISIQLQRGLSPAELQLSRALT